MIHNGICRLSHSAKHCAAFIIAMLVIVGVAAAQTNPDLKNRKIRLSIINGDGGYTLPKDPAYNAVRARLMKRAVLERFSEFMSPLWMPGTLWLNAEECKGIDSPHYNSGNHSIVLCYQFWEEMEKQTNRYSELSKSFPKALPVNISREEAADGLFVAVLLHEAGHALFKMLEIPVFGREEDAADQIAVFIALQFGNDVARTVIKGFASMWMLQSNPPLKAMNPTDPNYPKDPDSQCRRDPFCNYSDEHGTSGQRLYNVLCVAYGGNHAAFQDFVDLGWLPAARAKNCRAEYDRVAKSFSKTVSPFIDQEKMAKVKKIKWLGETNP